MIVYAAVLQGDVELLFLFASLARFRPTEQVKLREDLVSAECTLGVECELQLTLDGVTDPRPSYLDMRRGAPVFGALGKDTNE